MRILDTVTRRAPARGSQSNRNHKTNDDGNGNQAAPSVYEDSEIGKATRDGNNNQKAPSKRIVLPIRQSRRHRKTSDNSPLFLRRLVFLQQRSLQRFVVTVFLSFTLFLIVSWFALLSFHFKEQLKGQKKNTSIQDLGQAWAASRRRQEKPISKHEMTGTANKTRHLKQQVKQKQLQEQKAWGKGTFARASKFPASFEIIFEAMTASVATKQFILPGPFDNGEVRKSLIMDFGGLIMTMIGDKGGARYIHRDYYLSETDFRDPDDPRDDDVESYYAFDDDFERRDPAILKISYDDDQGGYDDDDDEFENQCRRCSEHRLMFPNCNTFHESPLLDVQGRYLSAGAYREVFVLEHPLISGFEQIILKDIHYDYEFDRNNEYFEYVKNDALVAERLTSSPRIYDIYGFCGLGIMSEFFPHGDLESLAMFDEGYPPGGGLYDRYELKPQNSLSGITKLEIATQMAEAIAELHGYHGCAIVHQDVQLSQFLLTADKSRVKLNDFNRAELMLFDEVEQKYCRYTEGKGNGNWRSPEEYYDKPLTEQIDVFSLGNNMYALLTGLNPLYEDLDDSEVKRKIRHGRTAYIDPRYKERSLAEAKLAGIIPLCYAYEPRDRPSIFELVRMLRKALTEVKEQNGA